MTSPARRERSALCDTFETVGPDAPTLCSPWRTRDLAAHLVIREGRPDAAVGMLVPPLAERARAGAGRLRGGAAGPSWSSGSAPGHRRGRRPGSSRSTRSSTWPRCSSTTRTCCGRPPDWEPRPLPADLEQGLWSALTRTGRLLFRRSPVGVVLVDAHARPPAGPHRARGCRLGRPARHPRGAAAARLGPAARRPGHGRGARRRPAAVPGTDLSL